MKKFALRALIGILLICWLAGTASAGPVMDRILKDGKLNVGITGTQPPLNATTKEGKIIGLDADIARTISANLGVDLKISTMPFAELLDALQDGKIDMIISGMTMTLERNTQVAFVGPYYISGKGILTKADKVAALQDAEGMNRSEFKIAALKDSTSQMYVTKAAPKAKLVTTESYDEAIEMIRQGDIDALVADYPYCAFAAFRYQSEGLLAGQSKLTFEPLGIAVVEDALLINWLQNFLLALNESGQMKLLHKKWFQDGSWIKALP